ncbi:MAG: redoxin family protein [Hyphomonadaceae bacterium]
MKRWAAILPLALLVVFIGVGWWRLSDADMTSGGSHSFASPERPAPDMAVPLLSGGEARFDKLGKPMIVNFWATWCTPCLAEHPVLLEMRDAGVPILGVLYKDEAGKGAAFLDRKGNPFDLVGADPAGDAGVAFGIAGVPETFLVDADGRIVKSLRSPLDRNAARAFVEAWRDLAGSDAPAG